MSKAGKRIIEALEEALKIAEGSTPAPRIFMNGHHYVPEESLCEHCRESRSLAAKTPSS